jgi:hypothetical protein
MVKIINTEYASLFQAGRKHQSLPVKIGKLIDQESVHLMAMVQRQNDQLPVG